MSAYNVSTIKYLHMHLFNNYIKTPYSGKYTPK